ncbi:hypothetical protein PIB30_074190 [Stylosanthes scabra]|uniref:Uncharacterized protein n=1 Tax=Stylosanthes scabra TaxID=79078 RepID=A0ABU6VRG7_9FABA|nr:hypothetical protein [Stylosanthes scabra]
MGVLGGGNFCGLDRLIRDSKEDAEAHVLLMAESGGRVGVVVGGQHLEKVVVATIDNVITPYARCLTHIGSNVVAIIATIRPVHLKRLFSMIRLDHVLNDRASILVQNHKKPTGFTSIPSDFTEFDRFTCLNGQNIKLDQLKICPVRV